LNEWPLPPREIHNGLRKETTRTSFGMSDPRIEPLIDTEEAAALLRIHPKTLQRMARRGEVRGYQLGKLWRFRASDLVKIVSVEVAS
jgi:excisionase family DNA binding protein